MKKRLFFLLIILTSLLPIAAHAQVRIFIYHAHSNMEFSGPRFTEHMDFLYNNGFHTITLDHLYDWMTNDAPLPIRPILITFDDNYIDVYNTSYPILKARDFTANNYAHTNYVGGTGKCTWAQILEMESDGAFITESHTKNHVNLATQTLAVAKDEIEGSKAAVETNMGKTCEHIAYPYGGYNEQVISLTTDAGYLTATTTVPGPIFRNTPKYELGRYGGDYIDVNIFRQRTGFDEFPALPGNGWTLDNKDPNFSDYGAGTESTSVSGYYSSNYVAYSPGTGVKCSRWAAYLPEAGQYKVYARWTADPNRASGVRYEIHHEEGITDVYVDQKNNGAQWNSLGIFSFTEETAAMVFLYDSSEGYVVADAIWFEPHTPSGISSWAMY